MDLGDFIYTVSLSLGIENQAFMEIIKSTYSTLKAGPLLYATKNMNVDALYYTFKEISAVVPSRLDLAVRLIVIMLKCMF